MIPHREMKISDILKMKGCGGKYEVILFPLGISFWTLAVDLRIF